jgi:hypothetical protein
MVRYKKHVANDGWSQWHRTVLDLATMTERLIAEPNTIDDQAMWLDDATLAAARAADPSTSGSPTDVWTVRADGGGSRVGLSPSALRPPSPVKFDYCTATA